MRTAPKALIAAALLALAAALGAYAYLSRPIAPPSVAIEDAGRPDADGSGRYVISPAESKAEFHIGEVLRGEPFMVVGTTDQVSGDIAFDPERPSETEVGAIRINARTLQTDSRQRDGAIARFILKSEEPANEFIVFTPKEITGLPAKVEAATPFTFTMKGDLTVSGTTREVTFTGAAQLIDPSRLGGAAEATVRYKDFGLSVPNVPFVASVDEEMKLKISFVAVKG